MLVTCNQVNDNIKNTVTNWFFLMKKEKKRKKLLCLLVNNVTIMTNRDLYTGMDGEAYLKPINGFC